VIPERFRESSFESYRPRNQRQEKALATLSGQVAGSWYLTGSYGSGKTHLLYAQFRAMVHEGKIRCHVRTTRELVEELRRAEFDEDFMSPVALAASRREPYHLFWDDIDKLKLTDFKTEVLFDLVDNLYRQKHGLTVTGNYSMRDLVEHERMHPAIVRRLDDMCTALEL
jgi:DNA replication protein DnaC